MERQAGILQQRVEPLPVRRRRPEPGKGVRGDEKEGIEAEREDGLCAERCDQSPLARPVRKHGDECSGDGEDRHPHEHRAFVVPPRARDLVDEGLVARAVLENERHRHVAAREDDQQHGEGDQRQDALDDGDGAHRPANVGAAAKRHHHQHELEERESGGQPERGKAGFGNHFCSVFPALCSAERLPRSGGM
jgi:hypothetical protein